MWRTIPEPKFEDIIVEYLDEGKVAVVSLNRPKKFNAFTFEQFDKFRQTMEYLGRRGSDVRAIVVTGVGKHFTAGLDLTSAMQMQELKNAGDESDPARAGQQFFGVVNALQEGLSSCEKVKVPVIAAVHGFCIGAGVDLISACDIRYCSKDTKFTIREVDIGLAADVGTLQRFPKVVGNDSWTRELAYTARFFDPEEAMKYGFVSKVFESAEATKKAAIDLAKLIASKSPVAVAASKQSIVYSRDHSVQEGLDHIATINSAML